MSATTYRIAYKGKLTSKEIKNIIDNIKTGFLYKAKDFYDEVSKLGKWEKVNEEDSFNLINIWDSDTDYGPIEGMENIGLYLLFDYIEDEYKAAYAYYLD